MTRAGRLLGCLCLPLVFACTGSTGPEREHRVHKAGAYAAALSHDARAVVVGRRLGSVDLATLEGAPVQDLTYRADGDDRLVTAAFDPTDAFLATGTRDLVVLWTRAEGAVVRAWIPPAEPRALALSRGGEHALLAMALPTVAFFDARSGRLLQQLYHEDAVGTVALDDAGRVALTGSDDGTARLWSMVDGRELRRWNHERPVTLVRLSGDGRLALIAESRGRVALWDARSGRPLALLYERNPGLTSARFSTDGTRLLLGGDDLAVSLWDTRNGAALGRWRGRTRNHWRPDGEAVLDVAFRDGGTAVAAIAENGLAFEFATGS